MKMNLGRKFAMILAVLLMVPFFWNQNTASASAATPAFTQSKVVIDGGGQTYQLEIKNKVTGSKYKWTATNTRVARVSSKGLVTAVDKGTSSIKCVITYTTGKTKTLTCLVTVTIPATAIKINNATEVKGAHTLLLGETFDFNNDLVPANSSDKTYWTVEEGDAECIRINDNLSGSVTGIKAGKVVLRATAAKEATQSEAAKSIINDAVIIEVIAPTATIKSAELIGSTEMKVVFDTQIDGSTVIGLNNKLLDSIEVLMRKDTKGVLSSDPGTLTASLSADLKTLTITSTNMFEGEYGVNFSSKIKTTSGLAIESDYKQLTFVDNIAPAIIATDLDDTGMIATIKFSEPIDFTNFKVSGAMLLVVSSTTSNADPNTISTLNNKLNYIISADKKSLAINLSRIASIDYGKTFSVVISGIKDMAGNTPASFTLTAILHTDNSAKAQARWLYVARTSYNTVTATFDRAIQIGGGGWIAINGGTTLGVVDANDNKKVNYTISDTDALLTGNKTISIGYWNSYNVSPSDTSAQQLRDVNVDFTTDKNSPVLLTYEYDAPTNVLTLTYNKDVNLSSVAGIFNSTLVTASDEIKANTNITYTMVLNADKKVLKLKMGNMTLIGNYTFTLEQGFVKDNYRNYNVARTITVSSSSGTASELPGPYWIIQSPTNLSQISLEFAFKLDIASAQTISNYSIAGVTVISAQVTNNTSDNGATVLLTVLDGSIAETVERPVIITGVKGYNGSYSEIIEFTKLVELKDNKKPYYIEPAVYDKTTLNTVKLNFNEQIKGSLTVKVIQMGTTPVELANTVIINGNTAYITLSSIPVNGTYLKIEVLSNNITDMSGNTSTIPSIIGTLVNFQ